MKKIFFVMTIFVVNSSLAFEDSHWFSFPYKGLFSRISNTKELMNKLSDFNSDCDHRLSENYIIRSELNSNFGSIPKNPIQMEIDVDSQIIPLKISNQDNRVDIPFNSEWVDKEAVVRINRPKGTVKFEFSVGMNLKENTTTIIYSDVLGAKECYDNAIEIVAGAVSFLAPLTRTFKISCGQECLATIQDSKRQTLKTIAPDQNDGYITIDLNDRSNHLWSTITTSKPVTFSKFSTKVPDSYFDKHPTMFYLRKELKLL